MSFSEKLQNLRKENKMSQEKLADLLDVTRQSVSKWESGLTYPEMDKLLAMCKIFKCSLDDLTNDEVTCVKIEDKKKTNLNNFIDSGLDFIEKTYHMIRQMSLAEITKCIFVMGCITLLLFLLNGPFRFLKHSVYSIISVISNDTIVAFLSRSFYLIVDICYFISFILAWVYLFKLIFLDHYDNTKTVVVEKENTLENNKSDNITEIKKQIGQTPRKEKSYAFFEILGKLTILFIKGMVCFFAIPVVISFFFLSACLLITVVLLFKGVIYIGVLLGIIFAILLNVLIVEIIFNFLFNRKNQAKRMLITFIVSIAGMGLSFGIFMIEFTNTKYIDEAPKGMNQKTVEKMVTMNDEFFVDTYDELQYIGDESLGDKVLLKVSYYPDYLQVSFPKEDVAYYYIVEKSGKIQFTNSINRIVNDLSKKRLYNYSKLYEKKVTITATQENIHKMKANAQKNYEEEAKRQQEMEQEYYNSTLSDYENTIAALRDEKRELEEKNRIQEQDIIKYETKLEEYKNQLRSLIDE
ncbi:MAG: helix-turn-helix domain-containing protein [Firmicutes bacterium]|nr:helix-turn-helix domain-containing protein [Bacillota bacterium]